MPMRARTCRSLHGSLSFSVNSGARVRRGPRYLVQKDHIVKKADTGKGPGRAVTARATSSGDYEERDPSSRLRHGYLPGARRAKSRITRPDTRQRRSGALSEPDAALPYGRIRSCRDRFTCPLCLPTESGGSRLLRQLVVTSKIENEKPQHDGWGLHRPRTPGE